ncbi:opioid growth factor receptor conserved region-domain-containing protein [Xylariomycetidae sp. FL2044]|nr:opioid growth factor receptor conserved region-domain-containing protein [Xylariomycetidae sp. FL2044]
MSAAGSSGGSSSPALPQSPSLRRLIRFYDPSTYGPDARGRKLNQILSWTDARLEASHDYIQILFPLPEGSVFNDYAPVIDETTFLHFRSHDGLKRNVRRAFERMMGFYGFDVQYDAHATGAANHSSGDGESNPVIVTPKSDPRSGFRFWLKPLDHNHLRITRIIRSLRVLGLPREAEAFYAALLDANERSPVRVRQSSQQFWERAATGPLHTAPDGTEVEWLEKYE